MDQDRHMMRRSTIGPLKQTQKHPLLKSSKCDETETLGFTSGSSGTEKPCLIIAALAYRRT